MEDEIVFKKLTDETVLVGVTEGSSDSSIEISGYGLKVKVNGGEVKTPKELREACMSLAMAIEELYISQIM